MKLLILGGTKYLGRFLVEGALRRGWDVTMFNRGVTNPGLYPEVEELHGDRYGDLELLANRKWDAVIDTSGYVSPVVRKSVELLRDSVEHYTFISTLSVYADNSTIGKDESAPVATMEGDEESEEDRGSYGARKARCEQAALDGMPGRSLVLRGGTVIGPYDYIDRFPYWLRRMQRGGDVLAPAPADRQIQFIDVRDFAEWTLAMSEAHATGTYNTTGPDYTLTLGHVLEACREVAGGDANLVWVDDAFLKEHEVIPWRELPLWLPGDEFAGFFNVDNSHAIAAGLKFRPLEETLAAILEWDTARRQAAADAGKNPESVGNNQSISPERERELLAAWNERVELNA
jgi:2'-hydroxyisoflavone reductase